MLPSGHYVIGPSSATLQVRTAREGAYARAGHDLVIEVTRWEATLDVAGDDITLSLTADSTSLEPRWGLNGLNSLTDQNRDDIRKSIATKILKGAPISFRSTRVREADGGLRVRGDLTIGPATREFTFVLRMSSSSRIDVSAQLMQSNWDIKPFSAMLGTLKVRDTLEVVCKVQLPASSPVAVPKPAPVAAPARVPVFAFRPAAPVHPPPAPAPAFAPPAPAPAFAPPAPEPAFARAAPTPVFARAPVAAPAPAPAPASTPTPPAAPAEVRAPAPEPRPAPRFRFLR